MIKSNGTKTPNGIIFHDFRRTVKTNMLNAGVDKVQRDFIGEHNLKGMDMYYLVPSDDLVQRQLMCPVVE
ncbi:MAG: hypothetical protein HQ557_02970 [Bacteroidetes bacterium]|nr:hypothetical protein [Bacteroidota bacterium]